MSDEDYFFSYETKNQSNNMLFPQTSDNIFNFQSRKISEDFIFGKDQFQDTFVETQQNAKQINNFCISSSENLDNLMQDEQSLNITPFTFQTEQEEAKIPQYLDDKNNNDSTQSQSGDSISKEQVEEDQGLINFFKSQKSQQFQFPFTMDNKAPFQMDLEHQQQQQNLIFDEVKSLEKQGSLPFKTKLRKGKQTKTNKKANYDKNICRYLTRRIIRCFSKAEYKEQALKFSFYDEDLYFKATEFFLRRIEKITGFRVLKQYLDIQKVDGLDEQELNEREYCIIFKKFYVWFLKERITRYILNGEMDDKAQYIKYKNQVMLHYSGSLNEWTSNKNLKSQRKLK